MSPKERYERDLELHGYQCDPEQINAIEHLQTLYHQLKRPPTHENNSFFSFFNKTISTNPSIQGIYLWGGVGCGKTYLMDNFFASLPFSEKQRWHFQRFMQEVHHRLKYFSKNANPLRLVAQQLAPSMRVLCLDEFQVDDVADAMLLAGLLEALKQQNVTLVFTSNIRPDDLYKNGLQRQRFLPAIELIKENTTEVLIGSDIDYRLNATVVPHRYFTPLSSNSERNLMLRFIALSGNKQPVEALLNINNRNINTLGQSDHTIWFHFDAICCTPRAAADYLAISAIFSTVIVSNIPQMDSSADDIANRFIQLIDALYDNRVLLIASGQQQPNELYTGNRLVFPFKRTSSRLIEMFSHHYSKESLS